VFLIRIQKGRRIRIGNPYPDKGKHPKIVPKEGQKISNVKEFFIGLEASPGT
jgi:hypothetical protein